jgi:hypothetical protein
VLKVVGVVASTALLLAGGVGAVVAGQAGSVGVKLSSEGAGARPIAVTLAVRTELQCGRLVGGTIVARFPAAETVPKVIAKAAVLVGAKPSGGVVVNGHAVTVTVPRPAGVLCDVIGPGTAAVVLTRAANLGNPARAGNYTLAVQRGGNLLKGQFTIR